MTIHLSSENYSTTIGNGHSYDGTWKLTNTIQGQYKIIEQYIDTTEIPWITVPYDHVDINFNSHSVGFELFASNISDYQYNTNLEEIRAAIQSKFQSVADPFGDPYTITVTINTTLKAFVLTFSEPVTIEYNQMKLRYIFETETVSTTATTFYWYYKNIDVTPHLFVKIPEVSSYILERDSSDTAIIFHTDNNPLVGMNITIRNETDELTISIYRSSMPEDPIEITNVWSLILQFMYRF
jgi:hypothetical protein